MPLAEALPLRKLGPREMSSEKVGILRKVSVEDAGFAWIDRLSGEI